MSNIGQWPRRAERSLRRLGRLMRSGRLASRDLGEFERGLFPLEATGPALFNLTVDFELGLTRVQLGAPRPGDTEWERERELYMALLDACRSNEIPITWAIAGRLLDAESERGGERHALDLVDALGRERVVHEIGCHSFDHPRYAGAGFGRGDAELDLDRAESAFRSRGLQPTTFVFPKNGVAHAELLPGHGFQLYRGSSHEPLRRDPSRTWVTPVGLWISPKALDSSDLVAGVEAGVKRRALVHFWFHLIEFRDASELRAFMTPVLRQVARLAGLGTLRPLTLATLAGELNDGRSLPGGAA